MERTVAVVTLLFALSVMVLAHGKEKHVMGKVTSTSDNSITVETATKQSVAVEVNDKTKFEKSGAAATLKDLKVGDKVVISRRCLGRQASCKRSPLWRDEEEAVHGGDEGHGGHGS